MKFLRNPWVTGVLAVAAVAVVFYQVVMPQLRSGTPAPVSPAPSAASLPPNPVSPASANPGSLATPALQRTRDGATETSGPGMNRAYLESRFASWVNAPQRDPFLVFAPSPPQKVFVPTNSPVASWKLTGIWNQDGSRLVVINNKVYGEGDEIHGFRLEKIEGDEVWLSGTNGLERLGLRRHRSAVSPSPTSGTLAK